MANFSVLIVDDELATRQILSEAISEAGYIVYTAADAYEATKILTQEDIAVALCDIRMPGLDGIELMKQVRASDIDTTFIMFTAHASVDSAVLALKEGAADYIIKPVRNEEILHRLRHVETMRNLQDENKTLRKIVVGAAEESFQFSSPAMINVERMIRKVAPTESAVLITGESGTGKGIVARKIHQMSLRKNGPFIPINCSAIPHALMESEFFGHTKGAFTGADKTTKGLFLQADHGTLFLDEIGELPLDLQPKLLHALEDRKIRPVGSEQTRDISVRIVAATNQNIGELIKEGKFREDLYFRLCGFEILVPPLRERSADIPDFLKFVLRRGAHQHDDGGAILIDPLAEEILLSYNWPGNIREFENAVKRSLIMAEGNKITVADLPPGISRTIKNGDMRGTEIAAHSSLRDKLRRIEAELMLSAMEECGGDRKVAAERLDISVSSLYRKLQEYEEEGLVDSRFPVVRK